MWEKGNPFRLVRQSADNPALYQLSSHRAGPWIVTPALMNGDQPRLARSPLASLAGAAPPFSFSSCRSFPGCQFPGPGVRATRRSVGQEDLNRRPSSPTPLAPTQNGTPSVFLERGEDTGKDSGPRGLPFGPSMRIRLFAGMWVCFSWSLKPTVALT